MESDGGSPLFSEEKMTLSAIKFVTGDSNHVCRLCLASTEDEELSFQDSIRVHKAYIDENVTLVEMFARLGVHMDPDLPEVLCMDCGTIVINSYMFLKLCDYSNKKWMETLDKLDNSLCQAKLMHTQTKTAYMIINDKHDTIFSSKISKTKEEASRLIKNAVTNRLKYERRRVSKGFVCEECGKSFSTMAALVSHIRKHGPDTPVQCPLCNKSFAKLFQLEEHKERLHRPKNIQCKHCPKTFSTLKFLRQHERKSHMAVICKVCFLQLPSRDALLVHSATHEDFSCQKCNKTYINRITYSQHLKICGVKPERIFMCDICGKRYARKSGIRQHINVEHGFGKSISCSWCSKKFSVISQLKSHILKHTKEKSFFCEKCGGSFVSKAALTYHIRLHTGEKPYPCDLCDLKFLSASRRMEHKRRKHFEPEKECAICHGKFTSKNQLARHTERHYNPQSKLFIPCLLFN